MIPRDLPLLPLGKPATSLTAMLDTKLSAKASSRIESAVSRENVVKEAIKQQQEIDDLTAENKRLHNELEAAKKVVYVNVSVGTNPIWYSTVLDEQEYKVRYSQFAELRAKVRAMSQQCHVAEVPPKEGLRLFGHKHAHIYARQLWVQDVYRRVVQTWDKETLAGILEQLSKNA